MNENGKEEVVETGEGWVAEVLVTINVSFGEVEVAAMNWGWDEDYEEEMLHVTMRGGEMYAEQVRALARIAELAGPMLVELERVLKEAGEKELEPIHG